MCIFIASQQTEEVVLLYETLLSCKLFDAEGLRVAAGRGCSSVTWNETWVYVVLNLSLIMPVRYLISGCFHLWSFNDATNVHMCIGRVNVKRQGCGQPFCQSSDLSVKLDWFQLLVIDSTQPVSCMFPYLCQPHILKIICTVAFKWGQNVAAVVSSYIAAGAESQTGGRCTYGTVTISKSAHSAKAQITLTAPAGHLVNVLIVCLIAEKEFAH